METRNLTIYVIYDHPTDYPEHWVVRHHTIIPGEARPCVIAVGPPTLHNTVDDARASLPPGLYNLPLFPNEDPKIFETWI